MQRSELCRRDDAISARDDGRVGIGNEQRDARICLDVDAKSVAEECWRSNDLAFDRAYVRPSARALDPEPRDVVRVEPSVGAHRADDERDRTRKRSDRSPGEDEVEKR